jgi:hypothetical protein
MNGEAFLAADFRWTQQLTSIWNDGAHGDQQMNPAVLREILADFNRIASPDEQALGDVIVGGAGAGKTHLMGSLRREVLSSGHFFVLLDFAGITDFWRSTALGFLSSLYQPSPNGREQFNHCLAQIAVGTGFGKFREALGRVRAGQNERISPDAAQRKELVDLFVDALGRQYGQADALRHGSVVRAYLHLKVGDQDTRNSAYAWLQGFELDPEVLNVAGLPKTVSPREVVAGTLWMLSCVRNTLIAVDQIDSIVTEQNLAARPGAGDDSQGAMQSIVQSMASGLMELFDLRGRGKTVVSCLEATWSSLRTRVTVAATDRFRAPLVLRPVGSAATAARIVESRLAKAYAAHGFSPPFPTWPFYESAFSSVIGMAPRTLLKACEAYRAKCGAEGTVAVLDSFLNDQEVAPALAPIPNDLDAKFILLKQAAQVSGLFDPSQEEDLRRLMLGVLGIYADQLQLADDIEVAVSDENDLQRPSLHARLKFSFRAHGERERHFCFRVLSQANAVAFQSRLRAAMTASGLDRALSFRHLVIVRREAPPSGSKTAALLAEFRRAGGVMVGASEDELRVMRALVDLREESGFSQWLRKTAPFEKLSIFASVGLDKPVHLEAESPPAPKLPEPAEAAGLVKNGQVMESGSATRPTPAAIGNVEMIPVGRRIEGGGLGREAAIAVAMVPRHIAILAGAGAGKTVLIRRLIEEAVLRGIPALVLDSNNDLSTLGDLWPSPPSQWGAGDAEKADLYHQQAEVVVWTPGLTRGRPITLDVLPDFSAFDGHDTDEFEQAIDMAIHTVASVVKLSEMKKGVLADALRVFGANGGGNLESFIEMIQDLPHDASRISNARKLAADIGNQLLAAIATNPLLRGGGAALDPRTLFTSDESGKTRISVINFVGLPSDETRQEFVNRLQMSLFTWIKTEPSAHPRLYVIDEARNFMPSQKPAASKESAISLAAQARKYGLGMIVATQTPKDIDNRVISNCTTHFYGKMNSPVAIETVRELMANKGAAASDVAALPSGTFYFSTEGFTQPAKIKTAMCLSHHPANPPGENDVVRRAKSNRS